MFLTFWHYTATTQGMPVRPKLYRRIRPSGSRVAQHVRAFRKLLFLMFCQGLSETSVACYAAAPRYCLVTEPAGLDPRDKDHARIYQSINSSVLLTLRLSEAGRLYSVLFSVTRNIQIDAHRSESSSRSFMSQISTPRRPVIFFPALANARKVFLRDVYVNKLDPSPVFRGPE